MINIYDDINKLEATFRKTNEYKALQEAVEAVRSDEEAKTLFTNFRDIQLKLQQKQVAGEELLEDEYNYLQKTAQLAQQNVKILAMLEAEMALSQIIEEVNRIIVKPIQSLYDGL
ncbi:YlbF family regulator [Lysinibacillus sp. 54212]|uniref:YlbF family regulator n=1 Tax=Lysinibacillus sp. 54212 TaxID=3119829 RepID=UPI002FCA609D